MYVYDLSRAPASFDFLTWLSICATHAQGPFDVSILAGPNGGFRQDNLEPKDLESRRQLLENVLIPATRLWNVRSLHLFPTHAEGERPPYTGVHLCQDKPIPSIQVPEWAKRTVKGWFAKSPVVLNLRRSHYHPTRNSNLLEWAKVKNALEKDGYEVVVVQDIVEERTFHNLFLRAALYEHALCVLGVTNGPLTLAYYNANVTYAAFKPLSEQAPAASEKWWLEQLSTPKGHSFPWAYDNQRIVWEEDRADAILETFRSIPKEKSGQEHLRPCKPLHTPVFINTLNHDLSKILQNVEQNWTDDLLEERSEHEREAHIVGGGPSLDKTLGLLQLPNTQRDIFALNNTHEYLIERGIIPTYHVLLDARPENARFVLNPRDDVTYLVALQCHRNVFHCLEGRKIVPWLALMDGVEEIVRRRSKKNVLTVGGGSTVGLKTLYIAYIMGYRKFHLYGFDSSYEEGRHHAYPQSLNDGQEVIEVSCDGRKFNCARWMANQAMQFQGYAKELIGRGCEIQVHGTGLLPFVASKM